MMTPQNVIQSMDQSPVPAPMPHAAKVPPTGAFQIVIAMTIVTTAPTVTACQADIRSTGSSTRSTMTGTSASSVLPSVEFVGSSDWTKEGSASAIIRPDLRWDQQHRTLIVHHK